MQRHARVRLVALLISLAAIVLPIPMSATPAVADEAGDLYLWPNNASDPDMQQCASGGVLGYCMYTSQDLNQSGNYPMSNTLGFFSTDGYHWTPQGNNGVIFSESTYVNQGWVQSGAKHLWAPTVFQAGAPDGNYYLFDPDVSDTSQQHSSSFIGVSRSTSGPFGPFTPVTRITNNMPDPNNFNQPWNGGYASDPSVYHDYFRGGLTYLLFANGDTSSRNCGNLSIATLDESTWSISNSQIIAINGVNALGTCGATGQPYLEGPSLYRADSWGVGMPGPYLLVFAAKPTSRPAACASNLGEPNSANEVIAYATASTATGPYTYKGILMCGSNTEWTNQATLMPLQLKDFGGAAHQAIAMYYHDGPAGNHNRKVHAQCLAYGGGNFAATMRPVSTTQGPMPSFSECMAGDVKSSWGLQEPNGQMVTTLLNVSGVQNGTINDGLGRVAMGHYERFEVATSPNGFFAEPAALVGTNGTLTGADLFSHANLQYVANSSGCEVAWASSYFPRYDVNYSWDPNTQRENVVILDHNALTNLGGQGGCLTTGNWATTFNLVHYYAY